MIEAGRLRGLSLEQAELYGKPHVGAVYVRGPRYRRTSEACCICGRPAGSCHHVAPRGRGETFCMATPNGVFWLRSPLFALCGSGTTGCHDGFHGGARFKARWVWDDEAFEAAWWDGVLLTILPAHSPRLYGCGRWEVEDRLSGAVLTIREEP